MSTNRSEEKPKSIAPMLISIFIVGIIATIGAFLTYSSYFRGPIPPDQAHWGQFGDFIGGVLNPIMGFLALGGLLYTIGQNQRELHNTRIELERSADAFEQNNQMQKDAAEARATEERKEDIYRMIKTAYEELKEVSITSQGNMHSMLASMGHATPIDLISSLHMAQLLNKHKLEQFKSHHFTTCRQQLSALLVELKKYLEEFKTIAGDEIITQYYTKRVIAFVDILSRTNDLDTETARYFIPGLPSKESH